MVEAWLFDLDGTLIDTAPDMGAALNNLLVEEGYPPLPLARIRPLVSQGGLALTRLGFADQVDEAEIEPLRLRFLEHYRAVVADESRLFKGFNAVLEVIEARSVPWGIVTNKPEWLAIPLLQNLQLDKRASVMIGGDTLARKKPDPLPLRVAAERLGVACDRCVYIGDDERDIIAGRAAGMKTLVAAYGYIEASAQIDTWSADGIIHSPADILHYPC